MEDTPPRGAYAAEASDGAQNNEQYGNIQSEPSPNENVGSNQNQAYPKEESTLQMAGKAFAWTVMGSTGEAAPGELLTSKKSEGSENGSQNTSSGNDSQNGGWRRKRARA